MRTTLRGLVAVLVAIVLVAADDAVANASVNGDYAVSGVNIWSCASTSCASRGLGYPGQGATISCYTTGPVVNGNPYWDYNRDQATGVAGYSSDYYLVWSGTLSHC